MSEDLFYKSLTSFKDFSEFTSNQHYKSVPTDWWVVITDVKGSTKAIADGRYKEVNLMGAASIASAINAIGHRNFPFVFGGDGATLLIPGCLFESVKKALLVTQWIAQKNYRLNLRVGAVPVNLLEQHGGAVFCAKHEITENNFLAVLKGSGLTLAEKWIKGKGPNGEDFLLLADLQKRSLIGADKAHNGLSCRWQPKSSKNGVIVSLVVVANVDSKDNSELFKNVLAKVNDVIGSINDWKMAPICADRMGAAKMTFAATKEAKLTGKKGIGYWLCWLSVYLQIAIAKVLVATKVKVGKFSAEGYKLEISRNTDHQKFDESLKMILDCSKEQAGRIKQSLDVLEQSGLIHYGLHLSNEAIMTCYVDTPFENQHVHFVDGSDGGYAMAASQIKSKIKIELAS